MRKLNKVVAAVLTLGLAAASPDAAAQDIDTFRPNGGHYDSWGTLQLAHPEIGLAGGAYAGVGLVFAENPLVGVCLLYTSPSPRD